MAGNAVKVTAMKLTAALVSLVSGCNALLFPAQDLSNRHQIREFVVEHGEYVPVEDTALLC